MLLNWLRKRFYLRNHHGVVVNHQNLNLKNLGQLSGNGQARLGFGNMETTEFFENNSPSYLKNEGKIVLNNQSTVAASFKILNKGTISIGEKTYINSNAIIRIEKGLEIGNDCAIGWGVTFMDHDSHEMEVKNEAKAIKIGDNVWIGANVTILKGVTIGSGCVIATGAVVSKSFGPNQLLGGVPAKIIKENIHWKK